MDILNSLINLFKKDTENHQTVISTGGGGGGGGGFGGGAGGAGGSVHMLPKESRNNTRLIVWNLILTLLVLFLVWMSFALSAEVRNLSSQNISQNTVLCGYIEDLQAQTGIDTTLSPNCQSDIETIKNLIKD